MPQLILLGLIFLVFYLLLIRPQQKKEKQHRAMVDALKRGDEVVTSGGLHAVVRGVTANTLRIEVGALKDQPLILTLQKGNISMLKPKVAADEEGKS